MILGMKLIITFELQSKNIEKSIFLIYEATIAISFDLILDIHNIHI